MEQISQIMQDIRRLALSDEERLKNKVDFYNSTPGRLSGYNCKKCLNRGYIAEVKNGIEVMARCECMTKREALKRLKESGISGSIMEKTFSSFETSESFRDHIKSEAIKFVKSYKSLKQISAPEISLSVEAMGMTKAISGMGIYVRIPELSISSKFYIDEDSHTFKGGGHTMSLKLNSVNE